MALELDAQERHRQAMGSLVQTREELERRVDDLRAFEREYRSRLQAWLEGQVRDLLAGVTPPRSDQAIKDRESCRVAGPADQRGPAPRGRDIRSCPARALPRPGQPQTNPAKGRTRGPTPGMPGRTKAEPDEGLGLPALLLP